MAEDKLSIQKLTEDLDKLNEEPVEKSDGLENAETVQDPAEESKEPDKVEEGEKEAETAEEPKAEEKKEEEEAAEQPEKEEGEKVEEEPTPEADPEKGEEVEKSDEPKKEEDKKADKGKDKKKPEDKEEKEKDEVKKSAPEVSEGDFVGAMEAVVKSFGTIKADQEGQAKEISEIKKSLQDILSLLKPEEVEKSEGKEEEEKDEDKEKEKQKSPEEPIKAEDIEKSAKEVEVPEGKATEAIYKSEEGLVTSEQEVEEEEPKVFNPLEHVNAVTDYYIENGMKMDAGLRFDLRGAVQRVKRHEATEADVALFKEVLDFDKK